MTTVAIFVDVQNVYYTTRSAFKRNFNYNRFWAQVTDGREVIKAVAYATDRGDPKQREFQNKTGESPAAPSDETSTTTALESVHESEVDAHSCNGNRLDDFTSRSEIFDRIAVTPGSLRSVFSTNAL